MQKLDKMAFLESYNISEQDFERSGVEWDVLDFIYQDYLQRIPVLEKTATTIAEILRHHKNVHSVRTRVKHPMNLLEKIIRKALVYVKVETEGEGQKDKETNYVITSENYTTMITDLIGIRVLHLYKDEALIIDEMIRQNWEPDETPIIYYRKGDNTDLINLESQQNFQLKQHKFGYRSWHYLIKSKITKEEYVGEIQVRTIFEEGWSEIDHQLRYPYNLDNQLLKNHLLLLNRLAGSADEMVNNIKDTIKSLNEYKDKEEQQEKIIQSLQRKIKSLSEEYQMKESDYNALKEELEGLQKSQEKLSISTNFWSNEPFNITETLVYPSKEVDSTSLLLRTPSLYTDPITIKTSEKKE